jgi:hypothetical protein
MSGDLSPERVAARLDRLRVLWRPLSEADARALTEDPCGLDRRESFEAAVARRLDELRALYELSQSLQSAAEGHAGPATPRP